jgi:hypothetical protein
MRKNTTTTTTVTVMLLSVAVVYGKKQRTMLPVRCWVYHVHKNKHKPKTL